MSDLLQEITTILQDRKSADPSTSYVASLYAGAPDEILKKIGEEATEVIIAGKSSDKDAIIHEIADLWFHTLVLLASLDLGPEQVINELSGRFGRSGLEEKASRATDR
jgi:phosphoribosyl-ATP pyrophosphohydrolase